MKRDSLFAAGGYFLALVFMVIPLIDVTVGSLPFRPTEMLWRFAFVGLFAEGVMPTLFGMFLALAVAVSLGHRGMVKLLGVVYALGFFAFVGVTGLFLLEAMSVRSLVAADAQSAMGIASVAAVMKHSAGAIGTALLALTARAELRHRGSAGGKAGGQSKVFSAGRS